MEDPVIAAFEYLDSEGSPVPPLSIQAGSAKSADVVSVSSNGHLNRAALAGKAPENFDYGTHCGMTERSVGEVIRRAANHLELVGMLPAGAVHDIKSYFIPAWSELFTVLDSPAAQAAGPARSKLITTFWRALDHTFGRAVSEGWTFRRHGGKVDEVAYLRILCALSLLTLPVDVAKLMPTFSAPRPSSRGSGDAGQGGGRRGTKRARGGFTGSGDGRPPRNTAPGADE